MLRRCSAVALGLLVAAAFAAAPAMAKSGLFISSAVEGGDDTVTLPLYHGTSGGGDVWFVVLDASTGAAADRLGVNRAQKLQNAGSGAVQRVDATLDDVVAGRAVFPATVDFGPVRVVVPAPGTGFPPLAAAPGARGNPGYSPLVQLRDGTVLNAPQLANATGRADKVVSLDTSAGRVVYRETNGFQDDRPVRYVSTDASDVGAAALEDVTYAPALNAAPAPGADGTDAARASLAAFVNGQTGAGNPDRQGLNSALVDGLDPLNVLRWAPNQGRYSPLWDVHPAAWAGAAGPAQRDWNTIQGLVDHGRVTGPGGAPFGPAGFIVDCPIVFRAG
jgi:hypothetical protein